MKAMPLKGPGSALSAAGPGVTTENQASSSPLGHSVGLKKEGFSRPSGGVCVKKREQVCRVQARKTIVSRRGADGGAPRHQGGWLAENRRVQKGGKGTQNGSGEKPTLSLRPGEQR